MEEKGALFTTLLGEGVIEGPLFPRGFPGLLVLRARSSRETGRSGEGDGPPLENVPLDEV